MLRNGQLEERRWYGLPFLRAVLEGRYYDFDRSLTYISIQESVFEKLRETAQMVAFVTDEGCVRALLACARPPYCLDACEEQARAAEGELARLEETLQQDMSRLQYLAGKLSDLRGDLRAAVREIHATDHVTQSRA